MARLSLHPRIFESEYSAETDNCVEENLSNLNKNGWSGRKIQKSVLPKKRSISIGQSRNDDSETTRLSRTSINLKGQIDQSKSFFSKSSSDQLPNEELDKLCNQCLNLLRQNKISSKNAFDILLIDHLNDIVNVQDSQIKEEKSNIIKKGNKENVSKFNNNLKEKNDKIDKSKMNKEEFHNEVISSETNSQDSNFQKFQRAAVTLEASARIYGYRVDSTFDNAYRILSNIKSGQILARNDSDCEDENDQQEGDNSSSNILEESSKKRKYKRNLIFSGENNTIVSNPESITIKEFERTKEMNEKPFFVNFLNDKVKIDNIRFGLDNNNIGSISSMLMNNLELNDSLNSGDKSASLTFNISGRNNLINSNTFSSLICQNELFKVNKKTLDLLLPNPNKNFSKDSNIVCPNLSRIFDSIQEIIENYGDIKKVKDSTFIEEYKLSDQVNKRFSEFSNPSFENDSLESENNFSKKHNQSIDNIEYVNENEDLEILNNVQEEKMELNMGFQDFQIHVERVIKDLNKTESSEHTLEDLDQKKDIEVEKKFGEFKFSKIGDVLDFLAKKSTKNLGFFNERKKGEKNNSIFGQKLRSKTENTNFEIPSPLLTNNVFNGIEWMNNLPKINQTQINSSRSKTKNLSSNKIFVGKNSTSSIFNYNLNHLFCLANLTGVKINLRSIHKAENSEETVGQNSITNDILIKTNNSKHINNNILNNSMNEQTDLMASHSEIEDLMQVEHDFQSLSQGEFFIDNGKDILIQSKLLLPFDEDKISDTDILLEKSSKSLHVRDEYNSSLKFSKSSNHVDIDLIKSVLKNSIQTLQSDNSNSLTLYNIINQSRKLLQKDGLNSVSTGIFFICILHICNENNYSLNLSDQNANSDSPIELNSENCVNIILNLNSSVDSQK
ncbi:Condensin complex subunit 2 family protein [Cryptosporidium meleagridis]|uniref:Condensin complex subunit 2 n=1 Tax=Cryptosporidium meleagridis TaxID=93969 RepID=A0A2P4YZX0_9CRYT|nr:Condensin complex subunit 2 family protein [Cryptosporidium meleagridis]